MSPFSRTKYQELILILCVFITLSWASVCPGKYLAHNTLFITVASVLSAFKIAPALDEHGNAIPVHDEAVNEMLS